jgi:hypothetical protein
VLDWLFLLDSDLMVFFFFFVAGLRMSRDGLPGRGRGRLPPRPPPLRLLLPRRRGLDNLPPVRLHLSSLLMPSLYGTPACRLPMP